MSSGAAVELSVSQFVDQLNQILEFSLAGVVIVGELANLRVSKNRWVYFDLKDETATVKFFGTVYQLPGPLEDGMMLRAQGLPKLHNLYGFSVNVIKIQPAGEGSIKRAAELLKAKLAVEGLFDDSRKRPLPYPPAQIGLVASKQSAAYADFIKVINARWRGMSIELIDVQVQGDPASEQIAAAIEQYNLSAQPPEVIVITRGGGSAEDLAAFNTELVTRAVAASRVPTLVAIGHEVDLSLAELAADLRASTPSNAAELLVPDREHVKLVLQTQLDQLGQAGSRHLAQAKTAAQDSLTELNEHLAEIFKASFELVNVRRNLLGVLNPEAILRRGYAVVRYGGKAIRDIDRLRVGAAVNVTLAKGSFDAQVTDVGSRE